ncbi:MAG: hypothetical protein EAX96_00865 [Candidatus Lokiarchaeota archaeon]|nr:hypothetical protein [Candidatus Lokiarchaeota archaeon]
MPSVKYSSKGDLPKMQNFENLLQYEETTEGNRIYINFNKSLNLSQLIVKAYLEGLSEFCVKFEVPVQLKQYHEMMEIISKLPGFEIISIDRNEVIFKDICDLEKMKGLNNKLFQKRLKKLKFNK